MMRNLWDLKEQAKSLFHHHPRRRRRQSSIQSLNEMG